MSQDSIHQKFGELAVEEGILSREELKKCISRHRKLAQKQDAHPSFKSFLIREQDLTEEQVRQIEQKMREVPEQLQLPGYEIERKLGSGTAGTVYKAKQIKLDRPVAIKLLHPSLSNDQSFVDRFYQEIRTVGQLKHPGIVQGIDVGEEDGLVYFIMEYVAGDSLADVIEEEGHISEDRAVQVGYEMSKALQHAAQNDLIHRDLKPDNIMFDDNGSAKLCDLGLAREIREQDPSDQELSEVVGTPHYMSPEQARGDSVDIRSDLYSLGATLYHAVTGTTPFDGDDIETIMKKHVSEDLKPPKQHNPGLSQKFNAVIKKLMAKDTEDRYQSPQEAAEDFDRLRNNEKLAHATLRTKSQDKRKRISRQFERNWLSWQTTGALILFTVLSVVSFIAYNSSNLSDSTNDGSVSKTDSNQDPPTLTSDSDGATNNNPASAPDKNTEPKEQNETSASSPNKENEDTPSDTFERIKQSASGIDGSVSRVKNTLDRLQQLAHQVDDDGLEEQIQQFRNDFLKRQSKLYFLKQTNLKSETDLEDASIENLVRMHRILQKPPDVFEGVSFLGGADDPLKHVEDLIKQRTREENRRLVSRIQHNLPDDLASILNKYKFKHNQKDSGEDKSERVASGENTDPDSTSDKPKTNNSSENGNAQLDEDQAGLTTADLPLEKQSENAELTDATVQSSASGYSGEGYVVYDQRKNSGEITWQVQLSGEVPSSFRLEFRYSLDRNMPCPLTVLVNGTEVARGNINPTGGPSNWQTFSVQTSLSKGKNTIILRTEESNGPNIDSLSIIPEEETEEEAEQTVSDEDEDHSSYDGPLEFADVEVGNLAFAINFGGDSAENGGIPFDKDPFPDEGNDSPLGSSEQSTGDVVPNKFKDLFSHHRVGKNMTFTFPLANGTYDIRLYFIEPWYEQVDGRVFHVLLQDKPVLTNFDLYKTINEKNQGLTKTFQNVPVTNQRLRLRLKGRVKAGIADEAIIAGIAIMRSGK